MTGLQNRGLQDIIIACVDGLWGFPDAINTVYPKAQVQLCIVHMVRNSLKYVSWRDRKAFMGKWDDKYPVIGRAWTHHWANVIPLFAYPDEIRKIIYTTNAIESLNSVIRKAINNRKIFPSDQSAVKIVFLAISKASEKWTRPIRNLFIAGFQFLMEYQGRFTE